MVDEVGGGADVVGAEVVVGELVDVGVVVVAVLVVTVEPPPPLVVETVESGAAVVVVSSRVVDGNGFSVVREVVGGAGEGAGVVPGDTVIGAATTVEAGSRG